MFLWAGLSWIVSLISGFEWIRGPRLGSHVLVGPFPPFSEHRQLLDPINQRVVLQLFIIFLDGTFDLVVNSLIHIEVQPPHPLQALLELLLLILKILLLVGDRRLDSINLLKEVDKIQLILQTLLLRHHPSRT